MNRTTAFARSFCVAIILGCAVSPARLLAQQYQLNASLSANDGAGLSIGDSVTLTLTVSNAGPSGGAGQAAVSIPDVFQFNGESGCDQSSILPASGGSFEFDWNSIPDTGGQLAASQSVDCNIQMTLQSIPASPVSAFATIQPTTFDPNPGSASYQFNISTPVSTPKTDLRITAAADPATLNQGQTLTLHLAAQNAGDQDAPGTTVFVDPPAQLQVVSSNCGAAFVGGREVWTIGTFVAGASAACDVQLKAVTSSAQPVSVPVSIASSADETNPADNSASASVTIKSAAQADLAVALTTTSTATSYALGDLVGLTLTVSLASGTQAPTGISANLRLPSKDLLANVNAPCGQFDAAGTTLTWNVPTLVAGQPQKCTISATIASVDKPIAVSADVASAQTDPNLSNNTASLALQTYDPPTQLIATPTTLDSTNVTLTLDGKAGVFESKQTDLVANNSNANGQDIFRFTGGALVRENVDSTGKQLVGVSSLPVISANGQVVAFQYSKQTPGASPQSASAPKGASDQLGIIIGGSSGQPKHQLDVATNGAQPNGVSGSTSVSADGHKLVFCSTASNLVANDTNNAKDVFLVDPLNPAQATVRVSVDSNGNQLPGDSCEPRISPDGTAVVFTTSAPNLYGTAARQVVSKNLSSGLLQLVSASTAGANTGGNADSSQPSPNSNARTVAFVSKASNLDGLAAAPAGGAEVFVSSTTSDSDAAPRSVSRARNAGSPAPNGPSQSPAISCDGSTVVFQSSATNLPGATSDQQGMFVYSPQSSQVMAAGNRGPVANTNPSISCDGTALGFDSNLSQPSTNSKNQNVFSQTTPAMTLDASFSGQWSDPTIGTGGPGYGLVIEVTDSVGFRAMVLTWYVYKDGKPTWLLGVSDPPQAGTGADAGLIVVNVPNVYTATGKSFPLGEPRATFEQWGSIKLKFASKDTGTMSWTTAYPGFNSGSMQINHFALEDLPAADPPGSKVRACQVGGWSDSTESGAGFEFDITTQGTTRLLVADWFAFDPSGKPVWLAGTGAIDSSNKVTATMYLISGDGAQFPPLFNSNKLVFPPWGTVTFTFVDNEHVTAQWNSTVTGYGAGQRSLTRGYTLTGRLCQ